jgi:hypothetical protein
VSENKSLTAVQTPNGLPPAKHENSAADPSPSRAQGQDDSFEESPGYDQDNNLAEKPGKLGPRRKWFGTSGLENQVIEEGLTGDWGEPLG